MEKGTNWSITINNPITADDENIARARQKGWLVEGQLEKGDNGTPHYQLRVVTKGQQRFSALKKAFPRGHIELARRPDALKEYVKKDETRIGELPKMDIYPSMSKLMSFYAEFHNMKLKQEGHEEWDRLELFDDMIRYKIRQGFYVEGMGVNPQVRSSIKMYGKAIAERDRLHRQKTDRQTDENNISPSGITNGIYQNEESIQTAEIPQTDGCETGSESVSTANEGDTTDYEETNGN